MKECTYIIYTPPFSYYSVTQVVVDYVAEMSNLEFRG